MRATGDGRPYVAERMPFLQKSEYRGQAVFLTSVHCPLVNAR